MARLGLGRSAPRGRLTHAGHARTAHSPKTTPPDPRPPPTAPNAGTPRDGWEFARTIGAQSETTTFIAWSRWICSSWARSRSFLTSSSARTEA